MPKREKERSSRERLFNIVGFTSIAIGIPVVSLVGMRIHEAISADSYSPQIIATNGEGQLFDASKKYIPVPYGEKVIIKCKTNFGSTGTLEVDGKTPVKKGIFTNIIITDEFDPSISGMSMNATCIEQAGKNTYQTERVIIVGKK